MSDSKPLARPGKKTFSATVDGKEMKFAVVRPSARHQQHGQLVYTRTFRQAVKPDDGKPGAIVRGALESVMREQNLWDDSKETRLRALQKKLLEGEKALAKGGIKLGKAREICLDMRRSRWEINQMLADRNALDLNTAEAQAENARFNYFVSACTLYDDTGKPYWENEEAYLSAPADEVSSKAASAMGSLLYNLEDDWESRLPENKFLRTYKFVNDAGHLVNKEGHLIDSQGRRVNEAGRLINDKDELIDAEGNRLTEEGDYLVEFANFLSDEDETPVPVPGEAKPLEPEKGNGKHEEPARPRRESVPEFYKAEAEPVTV